MKASISTWSFPGAMPLEQKLNLARAAGFEGFELDFTEDGPVKLDSTPADLRAVRKLLDDHGLVPSGLATGLYWGANPASADPAVRARAARILERQLEAAAALEIDAILVVPGAVGVDFIPGAEVVPYADAYARARDFIAASLSRAESLGVTIGIENVWNKFLLSPLEMADFIDGFGSKRVGAYFDVGNVLATGYPEDWIRHLGPRIVRVHLKDYRRNVGTADGFVELLSGDVDWPAVAAALRSIDYDGWCAAEMIPPVPFYKHAPEVLIHNTHRAMQAIFRL
jgi:Sugar phosphate isomerases/epimerases